MKNNFKKESKKSADEVVNKIHDQQGKGKREMKYYETASTASTFYSIITQNCTPMQFM